jgi:AcrR family transcriptional regulator
MTDPAAATRPPIDWGQPGGVAYTIGDLVALAQVPASSIHHYRRLGLIPDATRTAANQPRYDDRHVAALKAVRSLRRRGCTLEEILTVLPGLVLTGGWQDGDGTDLAARVGDHSPEAKLIEAAIDAFGEHSFREVSVTALCERADVAKGTFYRCFATKEALFLATARAIVERASTGFDAEVATIPPTEHATAFARHLRRGLPVLFELAKRIVQESGPTVSEAATLFAGLARRLGHVVNHDSADEQAERDGGLLILLALVRIFEELLQSEITAGPMGNA